MHRLIVALLLGTLVGCGMPRTTAELPVEQAAAPTTTVAPSTTVAPPTTVAPSPTIVRSPTSSPAATVVPTAPATASPTSASVTLTSTPTGTAQRAEGVIKGWLSYPTTRTRTDNAVLTIRVIRGSYVYPLPDRSKVLRTVRGTVRYNADQPLPPDAKLFVHLADMRWVDEGSLPRRLGTQTIPLTSEQPLCFAIEYDPLTITGDARYAIIAEIRTDDEVLVPGALYNQDVITNGNPTKIDVVLK